MQTFDAVVIGAGAAGLFCASVAGQRGLRVLLVDHSEKLAEKIRISGGGRCNFTNRDAGPANFISSNPHFCRSALARYTAQDFIALVQRHRIPFHEKHKGQLFCDNSSDEIISMLVHECDVGGVTRWQPCTVEEICKTDDFELATNRGPVRAKSVVIATGGLSIPKIGASDFGYRVARQFGHRIIETRPALVPLTFDAAHWAPFVDLAGLSLEARVEVGEGKARGEFLEDLLFTHRGLSGPAILQISTFWKSGAPIRLDLVPAQDLSSELAAAKNSSRRKLGNELAEILPRRLAQTWLADKAALSERPMPEVRDRDLQQIASGLKRWEITPSGTEGYRKAEVTAGGVDTRGLSSQSMESQHIPGLYFIGEVVDVTGWLGGYNFQWAWSSAAACAKALAHPSQSSH
ncbi:MAG: NAD(P)/FAD-dependent oxidoreductase [Burkholderiales bacterium]|nr:NAD(P)/FAD-dependent oxidoreductase [Burkholderiales bacterium]